MVLLARRADHLYKEEGVKGIRLLRLDVQANRCRLTAKEVKCLYENEIDCFGRYVDLGLVEIGLPDVSC